MNITIKTWVEKIEHDGRGVPFGKRTAYIVKQTVNDDLCRSFGYYYSWTVANRLAAEWTRVTKISMEHALHSMVGNSHIFESEE